MKEKTLPYQEFAVIKPNTRKRPDGKILQIIGRYYDENSERDFQFDEEEF